ncbi:MAG: hypothetical protein AB4290_12425 [Spirulina sp.]
MHQYNELNRAAAPSFGMAWRESLVILGLQWLQTRKLIVDYPQRILTLG